MYRALKSRNFKILFCITAFDLILATLLNIPYTGVGKSSVADIARIQQKSPNGIPIPPLQPINANDTIPEYERILFGEWSFYNKQIGSEKLILYPVKLKNNFSYFTKSKRDSNLSVSHLPFLFWTNSIEQEKLIKINTLSTKQIKTFQVNELIITPDTESNQYLVFLQNYYPHWYYEQNEITKPVLKAGITFMAIPNSGQKDEIRIFFNPWRIKLLLFFSAAVLILYSFISFYPSQKTTGI